MLRCCCFTSTLQTPEIVIRPELKAKHGAGESGQTRCHHAAKQCVGLGNSLP